MRRLFLALLPVALVIAPLAARGGGFAQSTAPTSGSHSHTLSGAARHASDIVLPYIGSTSANVGFDANGGLDGLCDAPMPQCPVLVTHDAGPGYPGGDVGPAVVAVMPDIPTGACAQTDGSNSLPIGATLGSANKSGVVAARSVVDVNQVNALASLTPVNGQTVANNYQTVGWIYLDDNGGMWFQKDPLSQWGLGTNLNFNKYFGTTLTLPTTQNPVYVVNPPKVMAATDNLQTMACWSKGRRLVPGTLIASSGNA